MSGKGLQGLVAVNWVDETLMNDPALLAAAPGGVHYGPAPKKTAYPFVEVDITAVGTPRRAGGEVSSCPVTLRVLVVGSDKMTEPDLFNAVIRIQELLQTPLPTQMSHGTVLASTQIEPLSEPVYEGVVRWPRVGSRYRVDVG